METVDREHGVDILVDVGVIETAVRDHELRRRSVKLNRSVAEVAGCIERNLALLVDASGRDESDLAFGERFLQLSENRWGSDRNKDFRLHTFYSGKAHDDSSFFKQLR